MESGLSLGKIFGIPLRLHYTWFIIFALITASLVTLFPGYPLWQRLVFGTIASLVFFASIVAHELAHSFIAVRNGIPVRSITLFVFGGVSHITKEAARPVTELLMAIVGPLTSLVLAGVFFGLHSLSREAGYSLVADLTYQLAYINLILAFFNLIPGFPLDGGRVFRAVVWQVTGNYSRATRFATSTGRVFAYLFILGGILVVFITREWLAGLWLVFIGWFLDSAASASYRQAQLREALQGFKVRDVMSVDYSIIPRQLTVGQLVRDYILPTGRRYFVVAEEGNLKGIITLTDVKTVSQERWDMTPVQEVMTTGNKLKVAHPNQEALNLLELMDEGDVNQIPVVEGGKVIGMVARDGLIRFLRTRAELGI